MLRKDDEQTQLNTLGLKSYKIRNIASGKIVFRSYE